MILLAEVTLGGTFTITSGGQSSDSTTVPGCPLAVLIDPPVACPEPPIDL